MSLSGRCRQVPHGRRGRGPSFPALEGEQAAEVAIVGGGITGLSTALHLAARGVEAVVVETAAIGWGASGRNGG